MTERIEYTITKGWHLDMEGIVRHIKCSLNGIAAASPTAGSNGETLTTYRIICESCGAMGILVTSDKVLEQRPEPAPCGFWDA
jgi:hypothetical protein